MFLIVLRSRSFLCGQVGHLAAECRGSSQVDSAVELPPIHKKKYQVLRTISLFDLVYSFFSSSLHIYFSV
jgi:hypothetical protein